MFYRSVFNTHKKTKKHKHWLCYVLPLNNHGRPPQIHEPKPLNYVYLINIFCLNSKNVNMKLLIKFPQRCITPSHCCLDTSDRSTYALAYKPFPNCNCRTEHFRSPVTFPKPHTADGIFPKPVGLLLCSHLERAYRRYVGDYFVFNVTGQTL